MPQVLALIAAISFGIGTYFEKQGLHLGGLSPQMGLALRTVTSALILSVITWSQWRTLPRVEPKAIAMIVLGGGVLVGAFGLLCFYAALKGAPLTKVMPIAFTSPLFGALMAITFGGEHLTWQTGVGMLLTVGGIVVLTIK